MDTQFRGWRWVCVLAVAAAGCAPETGAPNGNQGDNGQNTDPLFATGGAGGMAGAGGVGGVSGVGGVGGVSGVGGVGGESGLGGAGGEGGLGGAGGMAGTGGVGGMAGTGGMGGTGGDSMLNGDCCSDGDCLCRHAPSGLTSSAGPYKTATFTLPSGTVHYPTDAEPPFAAVAVCGGFLNSGPEMADWGKFYASHGIVTNITNTLGSDFPDVRATKLLAAIEALKAEQTKSGSPLEGKLAGRYGTSGYSMGGGGTTIASGKTPALYTSVGLASWSPNGAGVQVPTLLLCGGSDTTAPCSMSTSAYGQIPNTTPKMMITISGVSHLQWFGPTSAGGGTSGKYALAFQKVYLEGDERWKPLLLEKPSNGTPTTNIQ